MVNVLKLPILQGENSISISRFVQIVTLTAACGCSREFDHRSCVTETLSCEGKIPDFRKIIFGKSSFDTASLAMSYTMRLFNKTIMVLEYNFPRTAQVVPKYVFLLGIRKMTRLMIATAAVQVGNVIRIWRRENNESDLLTGQHPRPNNQARYFLNHPLS